MVFNRLGDLNFAPKTLGVDDSFRVEQFYNGRALNVKDLQDPVICRKIFARLAEFHKLDIPNIPKEPVIQRICDGKLKIIEPVLKKMKSGKFSKEELV